MRRDDTGKTFGLVTVIEIAWGKKPLKCTARCECGKEWTLYICSLRAGLTKSCGCAARRGLKRDSPFDSSDMSLKKCSCCSQWLHVSCYHKNAKALHGVMGMCKNCRNAYQREGRRHNLVYTREKDRARYERSRAAQLKERRDHLTDGYVKKLLTQHSAIQIAIVPQELIEAKRLQMMLHRETKGD